jgi:hypothetical protein
VLEWRVQWSIYKGFYNVSNISYLNLPPLLLSFIPPPSVTGRVSTGIIFAFTYMCIHYLYNPLPASGQKLFCPPVPQYCRRKNIKDNKKNMEFLLD